jgi:hypothetical protein
MTAGKSKQGGALRGKLPDPWSGGSPHRAPDPAPTFTAHACATCGKWGLWPQRSHGASCYCPDHDPIKSLPTGICRYSYKEH